jgi:hypothetical protein
MMRGAESIIIEREATKERNIENKNEVCTVKTFKKEKYGKHMKGIYTKIKHTRRMIK